MAGWSNIEGCNSIQKVESSSNECVVIKENKLKSSFDELISAFLEESCSSKCFRPLPPMLGNGHSVDLLKLYFVVKLKGGFDAISRKRIWDEVGLLYGLGIGFGSSLKLIYLKYLDSIEAWLVKLSKGGPASGRFTSGVWSKGVVMALGSEYSSFVSNMIEEMRKADEKYCFKEEKSGLSFVDLTHEDDDDDEEEDNGVDEKADWNTFVTSFMDSREADVGATANVELVDGVGFTGESNDDDEEGKQTKSEMSYAGVVSSDLSDDGGSWVNLVVGDNVVKSSENSSNSKKCSVGDELVMDSSVLKEEVLSLKRKRECFAGMIGWMVKAAKNPTDHKIGTIPECSKWDSYGNDKWWKHVLVAREALFLRKNAEQSAHQKRHKMHPSMFDDNGGPRASPRFFFEKSNGPPFEPSSINLERPRQRLVARLDMQPTAPIYKSRPQQRIPIGHDFQVEVPEWAGVVAESDSKWLGTRVWPLEKRENTSLVKRDLIGKGREGDCGCLFPGTLECVKFHVAKRRMKLKFELASAFYTWKFDKMGEDCSVSWTSEEEKLFESVVKANPLSGQKRFWKHMCEALPKKSWVDQVNYYYNVFVLRRRAFQNRHTPRNIDSDDDETEYGSTSNMLAAGSCSSIFSSKKAHTNMK